MLSKFVAVVLLATFVAADIPSYIQICGRKNPKLSECVQKSVEGLLDKLRTGIPEMDIPSIDPVELEGFPLSDTAQLKAYATNVKFYGVPNFEIKNLAVDLENKQIDLEVTFKELILDADYNVQAKILVPIEGHGPIHVKTNDVSSKATLKYQLIKRNGEEYIFFTSMTAKLDIEDYTADFKPEGPDGEVLAAAVNAAVAGGRMEIFESIKPNLEKILSNEALKVANNISKNYTYNEFFPDRE